jgi:RNA polymerase sigma-70 factor, ECF subfamily
VGIATRRWRDSRRRPQPTTTELTEEPLAWDTPEATITNRTALAQALALLPDEQQTAVLLVLGQGLTYKEAADALGVPSGTLKWRVSEATKRLRTSLSEEE